MTGMSELKLQSVALEHENHELRIKCFGAAIAGQAKQMRPILGTSSLENSPNSVNSLHRSHGSLSQGANLSILNSTPKTPPASYRQRVQLTYNSLPRHIITETLEGGGKEGEKERKNVAFADNDRFFDAAHERRSCTPQPSPSAAKPKGLKGIFGKIKRSGSGNLEDLPADEFKRGGTRATAGARLGVYQSNSAKKSDKPFADFNTEEVCGWLDELGLEVYAEDAKRWLKDSGSQELISASPEKLEKELNLKTSLHRKKLVLALADATDQESDELFKAAAKLDTVWVLRWLEDIGLPQYKDVFSAAKMDGRMLHRLSMEDLNQLHITSCLHIASLRRGIQLMRVNGWSDDVLIRRSSVESTDRDRVQFWTAHRVWDWLRVVDLAEYAPNLRGAGVHGALMMMEPRFTAELLADLLSIPPSKTLLRRHLSTHFKELLGRDTIQAKRDAENTLGYQPLTLYSKIKVMTSLSSGTIIKIDVFFFQKKPQFSLIRKKSFKGTINGVMDTSDLVCPLNDSSGDHNDHHHQPPPINNNHCSPALSISPNNSSQQYYL